MKRRSSTYQCSNKGFTLLTILVGITVSAIVFVALLNQIKNAFRAQGTVQSKLEFGTLTMSLQTLFENPSLCGQSLRDLQGAPLSLPTSGNIQVVLGGAQLAHVGKNLGNGARIIEVSLSTIDGPTRLSSGELRYVTLFNLKAVKGSTAFGSSIISTEANPFLLSVDTNANGRVVRCGRSVRRDPACTNSGAPVVTNEVWSAIYLANDGFEIPSSSLQVLAGLDWVGCDGSRPRSCWTMRVRLRTLDTQIKSGINFRVAASAQLCPVGSVWVGTAPANADGSIDLLCANFLNDADQKAVLTNQTSQTIPVVAASAVICPPGQVAFGRSPQLISGEWRLSFHCATPTWERCL